MPLLLQNLLLSRCPHCKVDNPNLRLLDRIDTSDFAQQSQRTWGFYGCNRCGGVVTAAANSYGAAVQEMYPSSLSIEDCIPTKARAFLEQAINSYHAPSGAIMLSASAVDAMLKSKDYKDGNLYKRIEKAAKDHLITDGMAQWAHQIRLDANDERHADDAADMPTTEDAKRSVEFALALAEFLFVLPEKVTRGLKASSPEPPTAQ